MKFVAAGQNIKIEDACNNSMLLESHITKVEKDRLYVALPKDISVPLEKFSEGEEIFCTVITNFGIRLFNSMVIDIDEGNYVVIDYNPNEYEIFQRRKYLRINVTLSAMIEYNGNFFRVQTVDLGGGGIKFATQEEMPVDNFANMRIVLNNGESFINIYGKILKKEFFKKDEYLFFFTDINENIRSKIIKKCISVQASQVRKTMEEYESGN